MKIIKFNYFKTTPLYKNYSIDSGKNLFKPKELINILDIWNDITYNFINKELNFEYIILQKLQLTLIPRIGN